MIRAFEEKTGRKTLCNKPYSGTDVIRDYGEEHMRTGALIVYTSADSVFQVAAHEKVVPLAELYRCCELAREMLDVGRVIARPFTGTCAADFKRTPNRHDYSLKPPRPTMLDAIHAAGLDTIGVGKIYDIFAGQGVSEKIRTTGNDNGMEVTLELAKRDFSGLAFINLVDFDMLYGHRNDVDGYAAAATRFDEYLVQLVKLLGRTTCCLSRQTTAVTRPPPLRIIPGSMCPCWPSAARCARAQTLARAAALAVLPARYAIIWACRPNWTAKAF